MQYHYPRCAGVSPTVILSTLTFCCRRVRFSNATCVDESMRVELVSTITPVAIMRGSKGRVGSSPSLLLPIRGGVGQGSTRRSSSLIPGRGLHLIRCRCRGKPPRLLRRKGAVSRDVPPSISRLPLLPPSKALPLTGTL